MKYEVRLAADAEASILQQAAFIAADNPRAAESWMAALYDAVHSLESMPRRCPLAGELSEAAGFAIHCLTIGSHSVFFRVNDETHIVDVLRFRHAAQRPLDEAWTVS